MPDDQEDSCFHHCVWNRTLHKFQRSPYCSETFNEAHGGMIERGRERAEKIQEEGMVIVAARIESEEKTDSVEQCLAEPWHRRKSMSRVECTPLTLGEDVKHFSG